MEWIFWLITISALIHVCEEYFFGWIKWTKQFVPGVRTSHFILINSVFLLLCLFAALLQTENIIFSMSIASLIFVNAWIHIIATIKMNRYSPGVISSILLYLPLSSIAYYEAWSLGRLGLKSSLYSLFLGVGWMPLPITAQLVREWTQNKDLPTRK